MIATCVMSDGISGYGVAVLKRIVQRVDDDHLLDLLRVGGERRRAVRHRRHALDRRDDVGRGEVAAVVELDALAQLELPRQRIDRLPFGGKARARAATSRCARPGSRRCARRRCCWASGCDSADRSPVTSVPRPTDRLAPAASGTANTNAASANAARVWATRVSRLPMKWNRCMNPPVEQLSQVFGEA